MDTNLLSDTWRIIYSFSGNGGHLMLFYVNKQLQTLMGSKAYCYDIQSLHMNAVEDFVYMRLPRMLLFVLRDLRFTDRGRIAFKVDTIAPLDWEYRLNVAYNPEKSDDDNDDEPGFWRASFLI